MLIILSLLWWIALCFVCLSKKQYLRTRHTRGITRLAVRLTGLHEVTHALFLFSSLFAFSRMMFFWFSSLMNSTMISRMMFFWFSSLMNSTMFRLSEQETILANTAYTGDYKIGSQIDRPAWSYPCSLSLF